MTVTYRNNMGDVWHTFVYLATRTVFGRLLLALVLIFPLAGPALFFFNMSPGSKAEHFPVIAGLSAFGIMCVALALGTLLGVYLGKLASPQMTVTLEPECCCVSNVILSRLGKGKLPWRSFQRMSNEPDFFCFFGWRSMVFIPKLAFASRDEANRFFQTALSYWYEAKGMTSPAPPDLSGVWPPAPQTTAAQEPGGIAER